MIYLIIPKTKEAFLTHWYDFINHYEEGMIIIDVKLWVISTDGKSFKNISTDSL